MVLLGMILAACSSSPSSSSATTAPRSTTTSSAKPSASTSTPSASTGAAYEVKTATVSGLGTVLVDGAGRTLYLFEPDKQSGRSTCYGTCAHGWPPVLLPKGAAAAVAGPGVKAALLGVTHRTDGTVQVTYNRWPLYLWIGDSVAGEATGQALDNDGGLWYVLSPSGDAITTTP